MALLSVAALHLREGTPVRFVGSVGTWCLESGELRLRFGDYKATAASSGATSVLFRSI
jgi:hypothetical protein